MREPTAKLSTTSPGAALVLHHRCAPRPMRSELQELFTTFQRAAKEALKLTMEPQFMRFAAIRTGQPERECTKTEAAQYLRECCHVATIKEIGANEAAQDRLAKVIAAYNDWTRRKGNELNSNAQGA